MFEHAVTVDPPPPAREATAGLEASTVGAWNHCLSAALSSPSGLGDAQRVDSIRALEQLACVVSAAQAQLSAELDDSQRAAHAAGGIPAARQGRGVGAQIGWARRESPHRGQRHLGLAKAVTRELPATWQAWRTGRITEWKATLIARETACLSRGDRLAVDALVAADADRLEAMGERELVATVQAEACRIDPASFVSRRRRAEGDRHVTLRPAPDTMTWLTALLPVAQGVAAYAELTHAADIARAAGDPRGKGQVMADALVARILGEESTDRPASDVCINLVMTDDDLFGTGDEPAHLDAHPGGFSGPIPAELARELVVDACSRRERVWLRRVYCRPDNGEVVDTDARARLFPASLARLIRLRDRVCRTPWCEAPIRHIDHATAHADDGQTDARNGQGLCEACNHAKQAPGWRAGPAPGPGGHAIDTTLPTGHGYRSRPPRVVATVREAPIRIDYVQIA